MVITETSFPRGGVVQKKQTDKSITFGAVTKPKPRKKEKPNKKQREVARLEKQDEVKTKPKLIEAVSAELLSFHTLREGMIILGCVKAIHPTSIEVSLPGRMNGIVNVSSISQKYLSIAQNFIENQADDDEYKPLASIFQMGQVVCVKVIKIDTTKTNKILIDLSMQPKDIQADFQHQTVSPNLIMCVAIAECQEHGYVIETGVSNLRGFLPETKADLMIGGVYFCRVKNATNKPSASTATFELANETKTRLVQFKEPNVNYILPGLIVDFKITKVLKDGLQGTIFNGSMVAYINEHQLGFTDRKIAREPKNFEIGAKITARVLYIMPLTKIVYLSLNLQNQFSVKEGNESNQQQIISIGTIIEKAIVSHIGTGGIVLKLPNAKGIISLRSLKRNIKANFDMETLLSKYQANSVHKVRVLHYDPIDLLHICSVDPKIINEKYFSCNDVSTGDVVIAKIQRKLNDGRYAISVGQIKGYIHPTYLSKTTSAQKLELNRRLKCRVLCKNQVKDEIFLTNLKDYMDELAPIVTAKTNLSPGSVFIGVVKRSISDGWLIEFFDYLVGMIYKKQLTINEQSTAERFYTGQIVRVVIKHVRIEANKKHITLGLGDYLTDIGTVDSGKISAIQSTGLDVAFLKKNINGFVPMMYLSDFPSLVHALHRTYQRHDDIEAIGVAQNCYSIRDVKDISGEAVVVKKFNDIQVGDIIPAFIRNVSDEIIEVQCLMKDFRSTVQIHLNMFVENYGKADDVTLLSDQKLYVRILARNKTMKTLTCSARLNDVWPGNFEHTVQMVRRYFNDIDKIQKRTKNCSIKAYQIGQIVEGAITNSDRTDSHGHTLRTFLLDGEVKLYVTKSNDATKKGDKKRKILIVWIDYSNEIIYGTMLPKYLERAEIKREEEEAAEQLLTHRGFKANVLLNLDDVIIAYPTKWTNRFVYIPTRVHYNDFQPVVAKGVTEGSQVNVSVIDIKGTHFIGMLHNLYEIYSRKIDQTQEFVKLEVKDETENASRSAKKRNKNNSKLVVKEESIIEIKEESDDDLQNTREKFAKKTKKRKSSIPPSDKLIDGSIEIKDECDDEVQLQAPLKKKKGNQSHAQVQKDGNITCTPANKRKLNTLEKKQSIKRSVVDSNLKDTPTSEAKSKKVKRFSMKLSQLDGALDVVDSSSDEDGDDDKKLPGVSNFWSTDLNVLNGEATKLDESESSSDEEENSPKKLKLSPKERFAAARSEEARIREIEQSLADDSVLPTSIDQFDRLVMTEPNSSRAWINYMVFHVQATEIDKARAIGQKALKTIDVREQQDRLNIWVALLNMELRYGSKDAFDEVLKEALLVNEPFKVYTACLKIFADCQRNQELCDMVLTITKKFRQDPGCWLNAAQALFEIQLNEKAKSLLNRALNSLSDRDHISTISRFAILCNKFDEKNHAHALFEQILVSYPKRVDCWSQYIDILIKSNDVDIARQTLERAVTHKIPVKKMRTLFKKYLDFEQKYGNEETVTKVKILAANYVHEENNA